MKIPAIPSDEEKRLASLNESGLLESGSTPRLDCLVRLAKRMFDVPAALITLVDKEQLYFKSSDGFPGDSIPRKISFCGHTILSDAPMVVPDATRDERFGDNPLVTGEAHIRFYAGYPLRLPDGSVVGSFCLIDRKPRELTASEMDSLKDFAMIVEDEFAAMSAASTDALTGLFNRRGFDSLAQYAIASARRRAEPLTLAWIDLDNFKKINDTWGHAEGDGALKAMASVMTASLRESDLRVRIGGDEFAIVFSDTHEQGAWIAMQYLEEQVAAWNQTSGKPWKLQFSWGLSEFDHNGTGELMAWMKEADEKMYEMKLKNSHPR